MIVDRAALVEAVKVARSKGLSVVFTNGCFDVLHAGHISLLQQAASQGDVLVVAVNDDESTRRLKGPTRPIVPLHSRQAVLDAIRYVDYVAAFPEDTPIELIRAATPDVIVKGADYDKSEVVGAELVRASGGRIFIADLVPGLSTSTITETGDHRP